MRRPTRHCGYPRLPLALAGWLAVALLAVAALAQVAHAQEPPAAHPTTFRITIINTTAPDHELTRGAYLLHTDPGAFWTADASATQPLEDIAEDARPEAAFDQLGASQIDRLPLRGDMLTFELQAVPGQLLSTAQMFGMTNDAFLGLDSYPLFRPDGTPIRASVTLSGWDSGTEANTFDTTGYDGAPTEELIHPHPDFPGVQALVLIDPYDPLLIAPGGAFRGWTGPERPLADAFAGFPAITVVWRWSAADGWQAWSPDQPPALQLDLTLHPGDVLYIVAAQFTAVPI